MADHVDQMVIDISIHALRGEGDTIRTITEIIVPTFQSTPSVGRATATQIYRCLDINISIHALRGEGDS